MLRVGYMEDWQHQETYSGVPQGGIISPLLSNIVLNELDSYVDVLIPKYSKGKRRCTNPEYSRLSTAKRKASWRGDMEAYRELCKQQRQIPAGKPQDPNYRRLWYARYCNDFLLGFIGPKAEAEAIKTELSAYLQTLKLTLSEEKAYINHAGTEAARFLGYDVRIAHCDTQRTKRSDGVKTRNVNGVVQLYVPRQVRIKWLRRFTRKGKPRPVWNYCELSDYEIVETFGAQLRGLVNYYSLATNLSAGLGAVRWACMETARKTLAAKHKTRRPSVTHKRYRYKAQTSDEWGHLRVTVPRDGKTPLVAKCGEMPLRTRETTFIRDIIPPKVIAGAKSELLTRLLKGECELCGVADILQAHHIHKLKDLQRKWQRKQEQPAWVKYMLARRRKTLVVCHDCHQLITHGRCDGRRVF